MNIPINLASEPFRRDRPLYVASIAASIGLTVLLVFQIGVILTERTQAEATRRALDRSSAQVRLIDAEQRKFDATMIRPENSEVLERSLFLNELIDRKAISWTKLFSDLHQVIPNNVRLVQVRLPQVDSQNHVLLDMVVSAKDVGPVLDLLRKLEATPQFGPAAVVNSLPPSQTDPFYRYHFTVTYAQKL